MSTTHQKDNPQAVGAAGGTDENTSEILKQEATLRARFALRGAAVYRLGDNGFLVCQWTLTRHVPDLAGLAALAKLMGVI